MCHSRKELMRRAGRGHLLPRGVLTGSWTTKHAGTAGKKLIQLKRGQRSKNFLESDFDPLLPSQVFDKAGYRKPSTGEERLAWRKLERDILDVCQGPQKERLKSVRELMDWIQADDDAPYSFDYWCSLLGVDEGYMLDNFWAFLVLQNSNALKGIKGDFKILRQIEAVRIEQPHTLSLTDCPCGLDGHQDILYKCLSCGHTGDWEHFLGYTCVRGQPQPTEGLKQPYEPEACPGHSFADIINEVLSEESNNQPLNASDERPVLDQGSAPDPESQCWDSGGGCANGGGVSSSSCVGTVASGAAPTSSAGYLQGRL